MEKELKYLGHALGSPERPFVAILGGAKVSDKIEVIENLLGQVDALVIGGAMAYTFLKSRGLPIGKSLVEDDKLRPARQITAQAADGRRAAACCRSTRRHRRSSRPGARARDARDRRPGDRRLMGLDIGPEDRRRPTPALVRGAKTVIWNGPMGVFEMPPFAAGTNAVAEAVAAVDGTTIVGGGDSVAAVTKAGVADRITHISTGGGASLEFLGGRALPGVEALADK